MAEGLPSKQNTASSILVTGSKFKDEGGRMKDESPKSNVQGPKSTKIKKTLVIGLETWDSFFAGQIAEMD
jgi:hypothetical protein